MKNRNMMLFVVLSVLLLGGYNLLMTRHESAQPAGGPGAGRGARPGGPAPGGRAPPAPCRRPPAAAPAVDPMARFSLRNDTLELTWRKGDGALVQVEWSDGTKFFPEARPGKDGAESQGLPRPGRGGRRPLRRRPEVAAAPEGHTVTFHDAQGDRLTYLVPGQGHILSMEWTSPKGAGPEPGAPCPPACWPSQGLGRVFTIEPKVIKAVAWIGHAEGPLLQLPGLQAQGPAPGLPPAGHGRRAGSQASPPRPPTISPPSGTPPGNPGADAAAGYLLAPDAGGKVSARLYLGPKQAEALAQFHAPGTRTRATCSSRWSISASSAWSPSCCS